jgi:hypothetical protein
LVERIEVVGALFGIGAYAAGLAITRGHVPPAVAPVAGAVFATAFGFSLLRLRGRSPRPGHGSASLMEVGGLDRVVDPDAVTDVETRQGTESVGRFQQAKPLTDDRCDQGKHGIEVTRGDALDEAGDVEEGVRVGRGLFVGGGWAAAPAAGDGDDGGSWCSGVRVRGRRQQAARDDPRTPHAAPPARCLPACEPWRCSCG